ncbi:IS66 family transposase [Rhodopirellula sallentina]|uniref:Transposase, IS66 n=1 Tax=Rhodopirellula sallentina SM41 TaxID=1263870 RepID=M5UBV2_9BACT|nr:IS66 family transposase [Rhodopirellula sallentina]EMI55331.1 Transposase, IS66 [Rhodopirellula sallentina SM41]
MDAAELKRENERLKQQLQETAAHQAALEEQFARTIAEKDTLVGSLRHQIKLLLLKVRGSRQERIDPDQLMLFSIDELRELADELHAEAEEETAGEEDSTGKKRKRRGHGRRDLSEVEPTRVLRHELPEDRRKCACCGETCTEFAVESSKQIEIIPARVEVIQHDRVKYACRACQENVVVAPKPPQPIEKGLPGPGLCAHVTLSKFGDHTPLYRLEDIFLRTGLEIRRSTLCGWLIKLAELARPLAMRMKYLVLQSKVIHTDDTSIKMLEPGAGIAREAKFWPYLGDWLHPYAVYDFTIDRKRDGPLNFLEGYQGYLQADAYSGYDCIYAGGRVREVACWIHARRYWHQAIDNDGVRANTALSFIARLSQIEGQLREAYPRTNLQGERDFALVAAARQQHSLPILHQFKSWMDRELETGRVLPKSAIRQAFTYTLNQWSALCRYTEEGYLSFENNAAERLVKNPAIGRKNYLFVGGMRGGRDAAVFYSLVSSAKANGVEPFAWLRDVFDKLPSHRSGEAFAQASAGQSVTSEELDALLPDRWLQSHPDHAWTMDTIRRKERQAKEKRRRRKRRR